MGILSSASNRGSRAWGVVLVLLLHVALVWVLMRTSIGDSASIELEPAPIAMVQLPALHDVDVGPEPIKVALTAVPRLQISAPALKDIPAEEPEPQPSAFPSMLPPASALTTSSGSAGINGESEDAPGKSGCCKGRLLLTRVAPQYPREAKRRKEEGTTQALMRVDEAGQVVEVRIIASSGSRRLDEAAVTAFRQWKFVSVPNGTSPEGSWIQTSHRFLLSRIEYSLLLDAATQDIRVAETGARSASLSGSAQSLRRFLDAVAAGRLNESSVRARAQIERLRAALSEWGAVKSVDFVSAAGPADWTAYQVGEDARTAVTQVECQWAVLEVRHESAKTVWLIAVDRSGTVWSARAGPAL